MAMHPTHIFSYKGEQMRSMLAMEQRGFYNPHHHAVMHQSSLTARPLGLREGGITDKCAIQVVIHLSDPGVTGRQKLEKRVLTEELWNEEGSRCVSPGGR